MRRTFTLVVTVVVVASALAAPAAGAATSTSTGSTATPAAPAHGGGAVDDAAAATDTGAAAHGEDACEPLNGGEGREDPANDTLGWENGCWHDETISVTYDDGLNDTELDAVVARTMARVEAIRQLEFRKTVPVEIISREEFQRRNSEAFANVSKEARMHQNAKYEALFFVDERTDALAELEENRAGSVQGFYSVTDGRIVIISEGNGTVSLNDRTLAHELAHALQDQQFNISGYNRSTTELNNAISGLVEGDAHYIEYQFDQRCDDTWECGPQESGPSTPPPGFHYGMYFVTYQPYSDGPSFIASVKDRGGWEAVDELYDNPPASTEQVIHPERYPDDDPATVTVADRSDDEWRVLQLDEGINFAQFGEAGIFAMVFYPSFQSRSEEVVRYRDFFTERSLDPYDYESRYTDDWDGDKLVPYVTDDSFETNETGYVWKTVWDSEEAAAEFADGYQQLLSTRGAEPVDGRANTYRIPDDRAFGDAFYVNLTGDTVVIVNAPTVEELRDVRAGAAPEATPTPSPTPTATPDDDEAESQTPTPSAGTEPAPGTATDAASPGFGPVVALLALLVAGLLARRR